MEYLAGKHYPHLCEKCRAAVDRAHATVVALADVGADASLYTLGPEGPMEYAYNKLMLCGGFLGCVNGETAVPELSPLTDYSDPQWTIALVRLCMNGRKSDTLLPLLTSFEDWPSAQFADMAQELGYFLIKDRGHPMGGYYADPYSDTILVCYDCDERHMAAFLAREFHNPATILPRRL